MEKHEYYDSDMQMFERLNARFEEGTFTDSECDSFGHVMRSIESPRAIELLQKVMAKHSKVGDTYIYLGCILLKENAITEAIEVFEKAAAIDLYFGKQGYRELADHFRGAGDDATASKYEKLRKHADASFKQWKNFDYDDDGALIIVDAPIVPEYWEHQ
jgi:tetratricopeptide (TPR) repeat protein